MENSWIALHCTHEIANVSNSAIAFIFVADILILNR